MKWNGGGKAHGAVTLAVLTAIAVVAILIALGRI